MRKSDAANIGWRIEPEGLVLDERLRTSFQRCAKPPTGYFETPPTSLGLLPLASDISGALFLPMAENEAVWIGLTTVPTQSAVAVSLAVETRVHGTLDAISGRPWSEESFTPITVRGHHAIDGIFRDDHSLWAFQSEPVPGAVPGCKSFIFRLPSGDEGQQGAKITQIRVAKYGEFLVLTGCHPPSPLDLNSGYKGWRLP